jgi:hypothetical protein
MAEQAVWQLKRVTLSVPVPWVAGIRVRPWMAVPPLLLGLLAALIATQLQTPAWRGEARDAFSARSIWPAMQVEASLARSPRLAARVVLAAGVPGISASQFLPHSSAKPSGHAGRLTLLAFSVTYPKRAPAVRLANAYAYEFMSYTTERHERLMQRASKQGLGQCSRSFALVVSPDRRLLQPSCRNCAS